MKYTIKQFALVFSLSIFALNAAAQKERLDDLVPFKKGNKWGIVHHDGTIFFQPVLDEVVMSEIIVNDRVYNSVFYDQLFSRDTLAQVVYQKKDYYLTTDKKLISEETYRKKKRKTTERLQEVLENSLFGGSYKESNDPWDLAARASDGLYTTDSMTYFKTISGKKAMIKTDWQKKTTEPSLQFYLDGRYIPEFDCKRGFFSDKEKKAGLYSGAIVMQNDKYGYIDFEKEKLTIPIQHWQLEFSDQHSDYLLDRIRGVFTKDDKLVGREIRMMTEVFYPWKQNKIVMIAEPSDDGYQFYYPEGDSLSSFKYRDINNLFNYASDYTEKQLAEPLFWARGDAGSGIITLSGKIVVPLSYNDKKEPYPGRIVWLRKKDKLGFVDLKNDFYRKEPEYDKMETSFELNCTVQGLPYILFLVRRGNQTFYVDNLGKEFIAK